MNKVLLTWAPRALLLGFAVFLALFSLDVFVDGGSAGEIALELLAHNLPSLVLLVILAVAWRREWFGAAACASLGPLYIFWAWGAFPLSAYLTISGPFFLIALLYLAAWRLRRVESNRSPGAV